MINKIAVKVFTLFTLNKIYYVSFIALLQFLPGPLLIFMHILIVYRRHSFFSIIALLTG